VSWQPLLQGALRDRAQETLQAILDDLSPLAREPGGDATLAGGAAGLAILHGYLARAGHGPEHANIAVHYLQHATAVMADKPAEASLYSGLTGVGWALAHLHGRLPGLDGADECAEIDEVLLHHVGQSPWREDYDLISGLVGFGVYALERMRVAHHESSKGVPPRPITLFEDSRRATQCLECVIDRLTETAEPCDDGVTWWTNPAWLPAESREKSPRGYYNLGLAHGVPGVIALLGLACAAGVASGRARPLLEGAVNGLLARQNPSGFAHWVEPDVANGPARLAWCYGDPGIAAALLWAARSVEKPAWDREAVAIAGRAARRPPEQAGVRDAGLCHGAAGLGHLFNRLFQATGYPQLGEAAKYWFEQTLSMRRPGQGIGGYQAWQLGGDGELTWVTDSGLLTGSTGIALTLLAATTAVEPDWDRMLLTAIPPREHGAC
jgi:lantibiotic biosynthesis protein